MNSKEVQAIIDRLVISFQERARLQMRIDELERQLQPPKSVVKVNKRTLFLN